MDFVIIILRVVHIVLGATWVGMALFTAFFLAPAIQDSGPEGGKVMAAVQRRGLMTVLPILALGTLLSGAWLYWRASLGLESGYLTSPVGLTFGIGGLASVGAYALGIVLVRPAMMRSTALAQTLPNVTEVERQELLAEIGRLRARGAIVGRVVAGLLVLATGCMAIARYL